MEVMIMLGVVIIVLVALLVAHPVLPFRPVSYIL
jgi:hypothetical protein